MACAMSFVTCSMRAMRKSVAEARYAGVTMSTRLVPIAFLLTLAAGCGHSDPPPAMAPKPAVPAPPPGATAASPTGAPVDPLEIRWVRESAEHEALVRQVYRSAQTRVEDASVDLAAGS